MNWLKSLFQKLISTQGSEPFMISYSQEFGGGNKKMKSLPKLMDAICEAFSYGLPDKDGNPGKWEPTSGITYCNQSVDYVSGAMGFYDFKGLLANQMFDLMKKSSQWKEVDARGAQALANEGTLVIGAWKNLNGHGHVTIVRPGELRVSASWGSVAPKIMNIGEDNFIDKIASFAFSKETMPTWFALGG